MKTTAPHDLHSKNARGQEKAPKPGAAFATALAAAGFGLIAACGVPPAQSPQVSGGPSTQAPIAQAVKPPAACDEGLAAALKHERHTHLVAVKPYKKGETVVAVDSTSPITLAHDTCLVKLLVGPGATAERDRSAKSYSEGIGIEVWLPSHAAWNQRIRNYGGGGWVGGGHRFPGLIGSKLPAVVNANMGYASGTTDAGQPWYQDGSFAFLSDGRVNLESLHNFSSVAMVEQANKTALLVEHFYGRAPRFRYYDGHSQGGRQGLKVMQEHPHLYDGYLIGQPAISIPHFSTAGLYAQLVMKTELGYTALDKPKAAAFAKKVQEATRRAVQACDKEGLGFLIDPFACGYNPAHDAQLLCAGVQGESKGDRAASGGRPTVGSNAEPATCMNLAEANALNRIWYGPTRDGSWNPAQTDDGRAGRSLAPQQWWWGFAKGTSVGGITGASADQVAIAMQDVRYASSAEAASGIPLANASSAERNHWQRLNYESLHQALERNLLLQLPQIRLGTDNPNLMRLRDLGAKAIVHSGLADDAIPVSGNVHYHERVAAAMGGHQAVSNFLRMYLVPGAAHSSQGRPFAAAGNPATVPLPQLPGNANQNPSPAQDSFFTALVNWVERGQAPGAIPVTSRDGSVSYPLCMYPQKITWDGKGSAKAATSYSCK